eukprot:g43.t1
MDVSKPSNGESTDGIIHLLPKHPESSKKVGGLDTVFDLKQSDEYLIDGRVKRAQIGFSWTASHVDVDASLGAFDKQHKSMDVVWWDKTRSHYLSAELLNDDKTGEKTPGSAVNETIQIDFSEIPDAVHYLLTILTVYSKEKSFVDVSDISMKLSHVKCDGKSSDLFTYKTKEEFDTSAVIMGIFIRSGSWWEFSPIGKPSIGRTVKEVVLAIYLGEVTVKEAAAGKSYKIHTWVTEGRDLAASDRPVCGQATSDCYVEIKYNGNRWVSEVIMKDLNPKWNMKKAEIGPSNESMCDVIEYNVWDHDTTSEDDFLGCVRVATGGLCQKGPGDHELVLDLDSSIDSELRTKSGVKIQGQIVIKFTVDEIEE